jgi:large subunit ribosomal protein L21
MKKAVIACGSKQYLVSENDVIDIERPKDGKPEVEVLLLIEDENTTVGKPKIESAKIEIEIIESNVRAEKVTAIRYKAKKRVHKTKGHRQNMTRIKIKNITSK